MSQTDAGLSALLDRSLWTALEKISKIILRESRPPSTYNTDGKGFPQQTT